MESEWHDHAKSSILTGKKWWIGVLLVYCSFPELRDHILYKAVYDIHGAKFLESGLDHNFWLDSTSNQNQAFLNCIFIALSGIPNLLTHHLALSNWHLDIQVPGSLEKGYQSAAREVLIQVAKYFSQKLWPKPDSGNFAQCILPCKRTRN